MKRIQYLSYLICIVSLCMGLIACESLGDGGEIITEEICNSIADDLIELNSQGLCEQLDPMMTDLSPGDVGTLSIIHTDNLELLMTRLRACSDLNSVSLICNACIQTYPAQSEIEVLLDSSSVEVKRIIDISTPEDDILSCVRVHM